MIRKIVKDVDGIEYDETLYGDQADFRWLPDEDGNLHFCIFDEDCII